MIRNADTVRRQYYTAGGTPIRVATSTWTIDPLFQHQNHMPYFFTSYGPFLKIWIMC